MYLTYKLEYFRLRWNLRPVHRLDVYLNFVRNLVSITVIDTLRTHRTRLCFYAKTKVCIQEQNHNTLCHGTKVQTSPKHI